MKTCISIFKPQLARHLIKLNYKLIDIKADKYNKDKTIFIFINENNIYSEIEKFNNK